MLLIIAQPHGIVNFIYHSIEACGEKAKQTYTISIVSQYGQRHSCTRARAVCVKFLWAVFLGLVNS